MRGKGIPYSTAQKWSRITPAYAGKSRSQHLPPSLSWDHPRLCGEKDGLHIVLSMIQGSPPPMRGKGGTATVTEITEGITPAYAGKSYNVKNVYGIEWDHPRLCGEKVRHR